MLWVILYTDKMARLRLAFLFLLCNNIDRYKMCRLNFSGGNIMTYKEFVDVNNAFKRIPDMQVGKVLSVKNLSSEYDASCVLRDGDMDSPFLVHKLVSIIGSGFGCISNPSILKNWKGFK